MRWLLIFSTILLTSCATPEPEPEPLVPIVYSGKTDALELRLATHLLDGEGGNILRTTENFRYIQEKGKQFEIIDRCSSSCTIAIHEYFSNICWYPDTLFEIHGAFYPRINREAPEWNDYLYMYYPDALKELLPPFYELTSKTWFYTDGEHIAELLNDPSRLCPNRNG